MSAINGSIGQGGSLTYMDQLKEMQEKKVLDEQKVTGQNELKQEDFLSLLTKQLAQQDPFKPVGNDEMIAQMASFATVDGITQMNEQFGLLNTAMTSNQALQASSLVGQDVLIPKSTSYKTEEGGISGQVRLTNSLDQAVMRIETPRGELIRTIDLGAKGAGEHDIAWDGLDENGKPLPAGQYTIKVSGMVSGQNKEFDVFTNASVNSVLLGKGEGGVMLNLAGFDKPFNLAEVVQIGKAK
ncbi:flagellar basal body rod modification protein FlgD [Photobacterium aquae]|uniref:Basal-body rod modification protein FlgD n=1 Tax=Photobacterium aquae TaxID=1195763 RepID=A0A0J1H256_9GAMM|nr:flagellar hook assembly protein FlgD [Photobacterium aquae]KLV05890.1 flagellar basal body rod modification protein FlgD [Photobacterium aquae]